MKKEEVPIECDSAFNVYVRVRPLSKSELNPESDDQKAPATTIKIEDNMVMNV